jgi:hypothetical protein
MATASATSTLLDHQTLADLLASLGGISAARVRLRPFPGTATERDVIAIHDRENRLCELVDGTLVEKVMGFDESIYAPLARSNASDHFVYFRINSMALACAAAF